MSCVGCEYVGEGVNHPRCKRCVDDLGEYRGWTAAQQKKGVVKPSTPDSKHADVIAFVNDVAEHDLSEAECSIGCLEEIVMRARGIAQQHHL